MKYRALSIPVVLFMLWASHTGCGVADANAETEATYVNTAPDPRLNPLPVSETNIEAKAVKSGNRAVVLNVDTLGKDIACEDRNLHLKLYKPKTGKTNYPVIVFYHGKAFEPCELSEYDALANTLAHKAEAIVIAVNYTVEGQHQYPATQSNAYAAYEWVMKNAQSFNGDANRVALTGQGTGGNIAIAIAAKLRDAELTPPRTVLAIYPKSATDKVDEGDTSLSDAIMVSYSDTKEGSTARTIVPPHKKGEDVAVAELQKAFEM